MEDVDQRAERDKHALRAIFSGPDFDECKSMVRESMISTRPFAPRITPPRFDSHVIDSADEHHLQIAEREDCFKHIQEAKQSSYPEPDYAIPPHVSDSVSYVASHSSNPTALHEERLSKLQLLQTVSSRMAAKTSAAKHFLSAFSRPIGVRYNVGLLAVCVAACYSYADMDLAHDLMVGVPNIGDIPASGAHCPCDVPSTLDELDPQFNSRVIGSIRRKASKATPDQTQGYKDCYDKTMDEVRDGWMCGPFTKSQCDDLFPSGWHSSERFPQYRYPGAPCRPCDNFRLSGINAFCSYHERLVCDNAGFPSRVGRAFYELLGPTLRMAHGTDDLTKAYRQVCVRNHAYNVIAIWNPYSKCVDFFYLRGLPFGSAASVLQFNRYPQFISYLLNVFFGVCCTSYYDDYDVAEPVYSVHNAQFILRRLHELFGFALDKGKHVRAAIAAVPFLGLETDFTYISAGKIFLRVSEARVDKICAILRGALDSRSLSPGDASSLRGKLYFCMLAAFNKLGRAPLAHFTARQYSKGASHLTEGLLQAIEFFLALLPTLHRSPRCVDLLSALRPMLYIWTDAMYAYPHGSLGLIAFDPLSGLYYYSALYVPFWVYAFWRVLSSYIGQLEILAVLFAYMSLPAAVLKGRRVMHWIDNTSAIAGVVKGYSSKPDSSWMLAILHILFARLDISPWFMYVASKANCSDGPSRFDFSIPLWLRAIWVEPRIPTAAEWAAPLSSWIAAVRSRAAPRASGAARRARRSAPSHPQ